MAGRRSKQQDVVTWLKIFLSGGRVSADRIIYVGGTQGHKETLLRAAKAQLGIVSEKVGGIWTWRDPAVTVEPETQAVAPVDEARKPLEAAKAEVGVKTAIASMHAAENITTTVDISDPEIQERIQFAAVSSKHAEDVKKIVRLDGDEPFEIIVKSDLTELEWMLVEVRNRISDLESKLKAIQWKTDDVEVTLQGTKLVANPDGEEVDEPYTRVEKVSGPHAVGTVDVDNPEAKNEILKWTAWMFWARERIKVLEDEKRRKRQQNNN